MFDSLNYEYGERFVDGLLHAINYMTECDKTYNKQPDHAKLQSEMLNQRKGLIKNGVDWVLKNLEKF